MSRQVFSRADRNVIVRGGLPRNSRGREIVEWRIGANNVSVRPTRDRRRLPVALSLGAPDSRVISSRVVDGRLVTVLAGHWADERDRWASSLWLDDVEVVTLAPWHRPPVASAHVTALVRVDADARTATVRWDDGEERTYPLWRDVRDGAEFWFIPEAPDLDRDIAIAMRGQRAT